MEPFLGPEFGNPSSVHSLGRSARRAVEEAREAVRAFLGARHSEEVVFTSGGTESDSLALRARLRRESGSRIAISAVEHPAIRESALALARDGGCVEEIPVDRRGALDLSAAEEAILRGPAVVSVMAANNEFGGIFPVGRLAAMCRERGVLFHTDAVAAAGKIDLEAQAWGVDLLSVSAHKLGGPKGVGALYVRRGVELDPLLPGGGQERRRRGGTENVPGIVGFGAAARIALAEAHEERARLRSLRDRFEGLLKARVEGVRIWGEDVDRICNTTSASFPGCSGEAMLIALDLQGIAVSVGSACSSGTVSPSPAILALGASRAEALATLRFSFGSANRPSDADTVASEVARLAAARLPA